MTCVSHVPKCAVFTQLNIPNGAHELALHFALHHHCVQRSLQCNKFLITFGKWVSSMFAIKGTHIITILQPRNSAVDVVKA